MEVWVDGKRAGSGFVLAGDRVVTCAHVLEREDDTRAPADALVVHFRGDPYRVTHVVCAESPAANTPTIPPPTPRSRPDTATEPARSKKAPSAPNTDVAVLVCAARLANAVVVQWPADAPGEGDQVEIVGARQPNALDGQLGRESLSTTIASYDGERGLFLLQEGVVKGFSGGPVFLNRGTSASPVLVGMTTERLSGSAARTWCLPSGVLLATLQTMGQAPPAEAMARDGTEARVLRISGVDATAASSRFVGGAPQLVTPVPIWLGETFAIGPRPRVAVSWVGIDGARVAALRARLVAAAEQEGLELCDATRTDAWLSAVWRMDTAAFEVTLVAEGGVAPALPSAAGAQAAVLAELERPEGPRVVAQRIAARTAALLVRCPRARTNVDRGQLRARLYGAGIIVAAKNWEAQPEVAVSAVELLCAARDILPEPDFEALADRRAAVEACVGALVNLASDTSIAKQARRLAAALVRAAKGTAAEQLRAAFPGLHEAQRAVQAGVAPLHLVGPEDSDLASSMHEPVRWARTSGERWLVAGRAGFVPYLQAWVAQEV